MYLPNPRTAEEALLNSIDKWLHILHHPSEYYQGAYPTHCGLCVYQKTTTGGLSCHKCIIGQTVGLIPNTVGNKSECGCSYTPWEEYYKIYDIDVYEMDYADHPDLLTAIERELEYLVQVYEMHYGSLPDEYVRPDML